MNHFNYIITIIIIFRSITLNEISDYYTKTNVFKREFDSLREEQKQCIILRKYFELLPNDTIYSKNEEGLFSYIFKNAEYSSKSFQSLFLQILFTVSKYQSPNVADIPENNYTQLMNKLDNSRSLDLNKNKLKKRRTIFDETQMTEHDKIKKIIHLYIKIKNLFVQNFLKNVKGYDERIINLKKDNETQINNKILEIQKSYSELKNNIQDLNNLKYNLAHSRDKVIKKHLTVQNEIHRFKEAEEFLKSIIRQEQNLEDDYFLNIIDQAELGFGFQFTQKLIEDAKKLDELCKKIKKAKKILDGNNIVIKYYEMTEGFDFEEYKSALGKIKNFVFNSSEFNNLKDDADFINHNKKKFDDLNSEYYKILKRFLNDFKNKFETDILTPLKTSVGFLDFYKNSLLQIKKKKSTIILKEKELNNKIFELNDINMKHKFLKYKIDSEIFIENGLFIELQKDILDARNLINYKDYTPKDQLENKINQLKIDLEKKLLLKSNLKGEEAQKLEKEIKKIEKSIRNLKIAIKVNRMEVGIEIFDILNDINEIMDIKMASMLSRLQNMQNNSKCFSLPKLSSNIFKMMKTNMITFEKTFLKTFLVGLNSFENQKKFILYNYMTSENRKYGLLEIEKISKNENYKVEFLENFSTNFAMFVSLFRDSTYFARVLKKDKMLDPKRISMKILNIIKIPMIFYGKSSEKYIYTIFVSSILNQIILSVLPFLNFIPFINATLNNLNYLIFKSFRDLILTLFEKNLSDKEKELINKMTLNDSDEIDLYNLNFESIIDRKEFLGDIEEEKSVQINTNKVNEIEKNYSQVEHGDNFVFELFDALDNFKFNTQINIDISKLQDRNYLKSINLPEFDIDINEKKTNEFQRII